MKTCTVNSDDVGLGAIASVGAVAWTARQLPTYATDSAWLAVILCSLAIVGYGSAAIGLARAWFNRKDADA